MRITLRKEKESAVDLAALSFGLFMVPFIVGILVAKSGHNGWKWGVLTGLACGFLMDKLHHWTPASAYSTLLWPLILLIGITAQRANRKGWQWGLTALTAIFLVGVLFTHYGIEEYDPGRFSTYNVFSMLTICGVVTLYLWVKMRQQENVPKSATTLIIVTVGVILLSVIAVSMYCLQPTLFGNGSIGKNEMVQLEALAGQGDGDAQFKLGKAYYSGEGMPQNYVAALNWWKSAAEHGSAKAETYLGIIYYNGEGVPKDYVEALNWWKSAAEHGSAAAKYDLGLAYLNGKGVTEDDATAYSWNNLAAAQGYQDAIKEREKLELILTPEEVAIGKQLSREFLEKHGDVPANISSNKEVSEPAKNN